VETVIYMHMLRAFSPYGEKEKNWKYVHHLQWLVNNEDVMHWALYTSKQNSAERCKDLVQTLISYLNFHSNVLVVIVEGKPSVMVFNLSCFYPLWWQWRGGATIDSSIFSGRMMGSRGDPQSDMGFEPQWKPIFLTFMKNQLCHWWQMGKICGKIHTESYWSGIQGTEV